MHSGLTSLLAAALVHRGSRLHRLHVPLFRDCTMLGNCTALSGWHMSNDCTWISGLHKLLGAHVEDDCRTFTTGLTPWAACYLLPPVCGTQFSSIPPGTAAIIPVQVIAVGPGG